tara:strand:- start:326 stop:667 length:342 start_codon:yes stop_codon:yes gene_type:complete
MTLTAKEKRVRLEVFKPYAKKIADKITIESGWDTWGTFDSHEVSTLILQIIKTLMDKEFGYSGDTRDSRNWSDGKPTIKLLPHEYKPEGRQQIAQIWREIAANLEYGIDPEGG